MLSKFIKKCPVFYLRGKFFRMYKHEIQIRVRYAETDQMGYVYYGHYAAYFEVARVEMLRSLGFSYKKLEEEGVLLPVLMFSIKYIRPAYYDNLLTIKTVIPDKPTARLRFQYETYNEENGIINTAETTLVFVNKATGKPTQPPTDLLEAMEKFF
jgi:acyl-CoA thioester hydrolase